MDSTIHTLNLGFVNSYLVKTDLGYILVDTGIRSQLGTLEKYLARAGCEPGNLKLIVLTHGDIDHSANGVTLRDRYHSRIAMHRGDANMVANGEFQPKRKVKSPLLRLMHVAMRLSGSTRKMTADFARFASDLYLQDGQSLSEFGFDAVVLHIPGHTPGSIGLLAGNGDLICGDTLENRGRPRPTTIVADEAELVSSLERLAQRNIRTVYPGHGKPFAWQQYVKTEARNYH